MTGSVLLDTTIVVDHLRGKSPALIERFRETPTLFLPATALGELLYGAYNAGFKAKSLDQIKSFVQLCAILGIGEHTADPYGRISEQLARTGTPFHKAIPGSPLLL